MDPTGLNVGKKNFGRGKFGCRDGTTMGEFPFSFRLQMNPLAFFVIRTAGSSKGSR